MGNTSKVSGHVIRLQSHLAYGYGERKYRCNKCGEEFIVCYSIPPKFSPGQAVKRHPGILKLNFKEGVSGFANPRVLTAKLSPSKPRATEPVSKATGDANEGSAPA
jgi:hypothetical protein